MKILAFDHNKDHLVDWTKAMMSKQSSSDKIEAQQMSTYVDGMVCPVYMENCLSSFLCQAFHWYGGTGDRMLDGTYGYDAVSETHFLMKESYEYSLANAKHPSLSANKILLATEGCSCPGDLIF